MKQIKLYSIRNMKSTISMKSSIFPFRLLIALLLLTLGTHQLTAQENQTENDQEENISRFISFQLTLLHPVAFGDNFANDALSQKIGYIAVLRFYLYRSFFLGAEGGSFSADVENKTLVGNFKSSNANTYGITAGYSFLLNESQTIDAAFIYGFASYRNEKNDVDDRFVDDGNYAKLQLQYNYKFSQKFSVYAMTGLRYDFLDIDTSSRIDAFINEANYMTFGLGMKLNIFADKY